MGKERVCSCEVELPKLQSLRDRVQSQPKATSLVDHYVKGRDREKQLTILIVSLFLFLVVVSAVRVWSVFLHFRVFHDLDLDL